MLLFYYPSKKALKENIGKPLNYGETALFGVEYLENGKVFGSNYPHLTGEKREFFANVVMQDGLIAKVS